MASQRPSADRSLATASQTSALRDEMITCAPARTKPWAIISPIPREPPVTRTVLPSTENSCVMPIPSRVGGAAGRVGRPADRRADRGPTALPPGNVARPPGPGQARSLRADSAAHVDRDAVTCGSGYRRRRWSPPVPPPRHRSERRLPSPDEIATFALADLAPDPGWRRPVIVERELLILTTRGHGDAELDFHPLPCRPGTLLRVRPGQVLRCAGPQLDATVVAWDPEALRGFDVDLTTTGDLAAAGRRGRGRGDQRGEPAGGGLPAAPPTAAPPARCSAINWPCCCCGWPCCPTTTGAPPDPRTSTFHRFRREVEHGYPHTRRVEDYAAQLGCSVRTLTRACLAVTGRSAKQVVDERVALQARRLLAATDAADRPDRPAARLLRADQLRPVLHPRGRGEPGRVPGRPRPPVPAGWSDRDRRPSHRRRRRLVRRLRANPPTVARHEVRAARRRARRHRAGMMAGCRSPRAATTRYGRP